jgi:hypothetical protein
MPVGGDGGNFPPFFYQRNQVKAVCVRFYRHVKIRSWKIIVAPPESKLFGFTSMDCITTHFCLDIGHDDLLFPVCLTSLVASQIYFPSDFSDGRHRLRRGSDVANEKAPPKRARGACRSVRSARSAATALRKAGRLQRPAPSRWIRRALVGSENFPPLSHCFQPAL